jgi:hypothetical protein
VCAASVDRWLRGLSVVRVTGPLRRWSDTSIVRLVAKCNGLESLQLDCSGGAATPPTAAQAAAAARLISDRSSYSNVARVLADACPGAHGGASGCFGAFDVLLGLPTVRALRTFTLTSSSRWTDAHALGLRQQLPNLIKLRLESCPQLSDRGALELARLPNLRALSLIRNPQLSAVALPTNSASAANRTEFVVKVERRGYEGEVTVALEGVPQGVLATVQPVAAKAREASVQLLVTDKAEAGKEHKIGVALRFEHGDRIWRQKTEPVTLTIAAPAVETASTNAPAAKPN